MKLDKKIPEHIFRGYDIRGIVDEEISEDTAYTIGRTFTSRQVLSGNDLTVIVGHDNRLSSKKITQALISGLIDSGAEVVDIGLVTTPMYYFAQKYLQIYAGLMVTASHNPKEYNGFKFSFDSSGAVYGEQIQDFMKYLKQYEFVVGQGSVVNSDISKEYFEELKTSINMGEYKRKVVVDCGSGATATIIHEVFDMFSDVLDTVYICDEPDGNFPYHHPDPLVESNLEMLKQMVVQTNADCGLAFDGDGDRCGVVTDKAVFLPIDILLILYWRFYINDISNKCTIVDVKCGNALIDEMKKMGGSVKLSRVGNPYIKEEMRKNGYVLGGELSGHIFFADKWPNIDDGIYAGLRVLEILTNTSKSMTKLLEGVNEYYSETSRVHTTETKKYLIVDNVKKYCMQKGYECIDIDGVRVNFADRAWILIRYSNTEPVVEYRVEGLDKARVEEIKKEFEKFLR